MILPWNSDSSLSFEIVTTHKCIYPGDTVTYECSVIGTGTTVFRGSAIESECESSNNEIILLHSRYNLTDGTVVTCKSGTIVGRSLRVDDLCYISQLDLNFSSDLIGKTVECIHDNGTSEKVVRSHIISNGEDFSKLYITYSTLVSQMLLT